MSDWSLVINGGTMVTAAWDAARKITITNAVLQHAIDYAPTRGWT